MATSTAIKFYSKAYTTTTGEGSALKVSQDNAGAIVFDKTTHSIYVGGHQYGGSNLVDATFSSNVLTITKRDNSQVQLDFSTLATAQSVAEALRMVDEQITLTSGAGEYVPVSDRGYVSSTTLTSVNETDVFDTEGSDKDSVADAVLKLDRKGKATMTEVISAKKEIDAVETGAGLGADGTYTANTNTNYIKTATSLKDADEKLDAAIKNISNTVDGLTSGTVSDVKVNNTSVKTDGIANIAVEGTYNSESNKIATQSTVSNAINTFESGLTGSATIASKSGDVVTIKTGVTETAGKISNDSGTDIVLEEVATTGAAADVSIADSGNKITATNVEGALAELADAINSNKVSVASNDKIISMSNTNELSSTLTMVVEKQGEAGNQKDYIVLKGIGDTEITKVDATAFVKDGMLSNATLVTVAEQDVTVTAPYIKLSFNTDAGQQDIRFSVSSLVDTYISGDTNTLTVSNYTITPVTAAVSANGTALTTGGQVYTAIAATKGQDIQTITGENATTQGNYIDVKVTATKGASDDNYTLSTTSNVTTHAVETAESGADGLATALDVKTYVDTKVGTAIQSVDGSSTENGKSVTQSSYAVVKVTATTDSENEVELDSAIGLTIQGVSSADSEHMGLAEASDVKSYVDTKAAVVNVGATVPVNSTTATTLATVGGTAITAQASFNWEVYE